MVEVSTSPRPQWGRIVALILGLLTLAGTMHVLLLTGVLPTVEQRASVPFWLAVVLLAGAEQIRFRYAGKTGSAADLSTAMMFWTMLFTLGDTLTVLAALAVARPLASLIDRQTLVKAVFNFSQTYWAVATIAVAHGLLGGEVGSLRSSLVIAGAAVFVAMGQMVPLDRVMHYYGQPSEHSLYGAARTLAGMAMVMAAFGIAAGELVARAGSTGLLLAVGLFGAVGAGMKLLDSRAGLVRQLNDTVHTLELRQVSDDLTGLPNRLAFAIELDEQVQASTDLAVLCFDLHRFRDVNETLGFDVGDMLLVDVAERLGDVARPGDMVARLTADQFGVIVRGASDPAIATLAAERYLKALERPFERQGVQIQTGAGLGIALGGTHGTDAMTLLRRSEIAMYAAKGIGEAHAVFHEDFEVDTPRRLRLASDLRRAIAHGELTNAYQAKLDLQSGYLTGVEVLARWHRADGTVSPGEFIPIAERTGLIRELTRQVVVAALQDAADWAERGVRPQVAINISPRVLTDLSFTDFLAREILQAGVDPSRLTLEVTESVLLSDSGRITSTLANLEAMGIRLSIDDYGTGYSSLSYLRRLRVHELKVDRSFVANLVTSPSDAVLVDSTIKLGHALGLTVVAEGVEDQDTLERLRDMGCDSAQGFHIARPVPSDQFLAIATTHDPKGVFVEV